MEQRLEFSADDLKSTLRRRGPDSLGSKKLFLHSNNSTSIDGRQILSVIEDCGSSVNGKAELLFIGATLQLRGLYPIFQPLLDSSRNILVYNGKVMFGFYESTSKCIVSFFKLTLLQAINRYVIWTVTVVCAFYR